MTGLSGIELDHLFVFVEPDGPEQAFLESRGLVANFTRAHPGQGTANRCYCFDDAYLELLFAVDEEELASPAVTEAGLGQRAKWRMTGASPIGIALRTAGPQDPLPFDSFDYRAPFLPEGMAIPIAVASRDLRQPFLFRSPGSSRPEQWTDGRAGARQQARGLRSLGRPTVSWPVGVDPHPDFLALEEAGIIDVRTGARSHALTIAPEMAAGAEPIVASLPLA